jgi:hypothetical protein
MFGFGRSRIAALALLFTIAAAVSCSEKITSVEERKIDLEIWTSLDGSGQAAQASKFILTITGPGIMEPIVAELALSNGLLTGSVVVPAGPDRLFRIDAYDEAGTLIYSGQTIADVASGSELKLDIDLVPRVPMIVASPVYLETLQGDLLAIKIRVYHLPDVSTLSVTLSSFRSVGQTYITTDAGYVVIDPQLAKVAASNIALDANYVVYIDLSLRNIADRMIDANGYAEIATVYYQTGSYEVSPFETATFTPEALSMADKLGNGLPTDRILAEESVVLLYNRNARRVAYWDLGLGEQSATIYDLSPNGLDGTATGTTLVYGARGVGWARQFNGSSDYIEVPDDALLDIRDEITISMWVYIDGYGLNPYSSLICRRTRNGPIDYQLVLEDPSSADGYLSFLFRYGGSAYHTYRVDIPDSWRTVGWFHVLFSYRFGEPSSATMVLGYGCTITEMPGEWITGNGRAPAPPASGDLFMGKDNASTTNYFAGSLDEVELFDIAWTPEVAQYYFFTGCR